MGGEEGGRGERAKVVEIYRDHFSEAAQKKERRGIFGIDDMAEGRVREFKLQIIKEEIEKLNKGHEGNTRRCPKCGERTQVYKGDRSRKLVFDCGALEVKRAYYICKKCGEKTFPLDEKLSLVASPEQGRLREKLSLLGTIAAYHQSPELCRTFLGSEKHAATLRRVTMSEAELFAEEAPERELHPEEDSTLYLEIDGHMCPTREERESKEDQGFREAKVGIAFTSEDRVAENAEEDQRAALTDCLLVAAICTAGCFSKQLRTLLRRCNPKQAKRTVVLADGAIWIWNMVSLIAPKALQILDYAHVKEKLWEYATFRYGESGDLRAAFMKKWQELLFQDRVDELIAEMRQYQDLDKKIEQIANYFENNKQRMLYGTFRAQGLIIGSGAIESAGKRLAQGRIKGAGMRWNVDDVNKLLLLRCAFFDTTWKTHWETQRNLEDEYFELLAA